MEKVLVNTSDEFSALASSGVLHAHPVVIVDEGYVEVMSCATFDPPEEVPVGWHHGVKKV